MKIIARPRCAGKTTELLYESAKTGRYILVRNQASAKSLFDMAKRLNLNIPYPVTLKELRNEKLGGTSIYRDGLLIDNAELILKDMIHYPIHTMTISTN